MNTTSQRDDWVYAPYAIMRSIKLSIAWCAEVDPIMRPITYSPIRCESVLLSVEQRFPPLSNL